MKYYFLATALLSFAIGGGAVMMYDAELIHSLSAARRIAEADALKGQYNLELSTQYLSACIELAQQYSVEMDKCERKLAVCMRGD